MPKKSVKKRRKPLRETCSAPPQKNAVAEAMPEGPGVYLMKDPKGRVLYIGKAKNLRRRVSGYFQPSAALPEKTVRMLQGVSEVEALRTSSEVEALLTEARLIKDIQPKYNVSLKDGKSYPLLAIGREEPYPRVRVTRDPDQERFEHFGPFTSAAALRAALKVLQKIFRFRTCNLSIDPDEKRWRHFRPCLLFSIRLCSAPCNLRITPQHYRRALESLKRFLAGGQRALLEDLKREMQRRSRSREYEQAAVLRDQLRALEALERRGSFSDFATGDVVPIEPNESLEELARLLQRAEPPRTIEAVDLSNLGGEEAVGSLVTFVDGLPFKAGYRRFRIRSSRGTDDLAMMREVVRRRYRRLVEEEEVFPDLLLVDGGRGHLNAVLEEFQQQGLTPPLVCALAKHQGDHLFLPGRTAPLRPARRSPGFRLLQYVRDEAHRFAQHYHQLLRRKKTYQGARRKRST